MSVARIVLIVMGVLFVLAGLFSGTYQQTVEGNIFEGEDIVKPYSGFMLPLIIGGIVLIVIGALIPSERRGVQG